MRSRAIIQEETAIEENDIVSLLQRAKQGDEAAREALVGHPDVRRHCRTIAATVLKNYPLVSRYLYEDDLVQELLKRLWEKVTISLRASSVPELYGWLKTVAVNIVISKWRKLRKEIERTDPKPLDGFVELGDTDAQYLVSVLSEALERMPDQTRRVLELRIEGYTYEEIGRMLSISKSEAQREFIRALRILAESLNA